MSHTFIYKLNMCLFFFSFFFLLKQISTYIHVIITIKIPVNEFIKLYILFLFYILFFLCTVCFSAIILFCLIYFIFFMSQLQMCLSHHAMCFSVQCLKHSVLFHMYIYTMLRSTYFRKFHLSFLCLSLFELFTCLHIYPLF